MLRKCLGNCKDVKKADQPNDCPKDWKIISPTSKAPLLATEFWRSCKIFQLIPSHVFHSAHVASKADWDTLTELGVFKEVAAPHVILGQDMFRFWKLCAAWQPNLRLVDVTQAANGCGGCVKKAMNSDEDGRLGCIVHLLCRSSPHDVKHLSRSILIQYSQKQHFRKQRPS